MLVVGHNRFPESDNALATAAVLARRMNARVHVVHAVDLDDYPIDPDAHDWDQQAADVLRAQHRTVEAVLAGLGSEWSYQIGRGDPAELLSEVADTQDAVMIVVGTRGAGLTAAIGRLLGRSVTCRLVRRQPRPVLVVPGHRAPRPA